MGPISYGCLSEYLRHEKFPQIGEVLDHMKEDFIVSKIWIVWKVEFFDCLSFDSQTLAIDINWILEWLG